MLLHGSGLQCLCSLSHRTSAAPAPVCRDSLPSHEWRGARVMGEALEALRASRPCPRGRPDRPGHRAPAVAPASLPRQECPFKDTRVLGGHGRTGRAGAGLLALQISGRLPSASAVGRMLVARRTSDRGGRGQLQSPSPSTVTLLRAGDGLKFRYFRRQFHMISNSASSELNLILLSLENIYTNQRLGLLRLVKGRYSALGTG